MRKHVVFYDISEIYCISMPVMDFSIKFPVSSKTKNIRLSCFIYSAKLYLRNKRRVLLKGGKEFAIHERHINVYQDSSSYIKHEKSSLLMWDQAL